MSIDEERELSLRLDCALDEITPSPAPVAATLRRGKTIRTRRRIGVAAGLAAAVGIALAAPGLVQQIVRQEPATRTTPVVTVYPPGPHPPSGQIAWGTVNGKRWQVTVHGAGTGPLGQCIEIDETKGHSSPSCGQAMTATQDGSDLLYSAGFSDNGVFYQYGVVQPDVARLVVALADGTKLTLHPYLLYGQRWVAFAVPVDLTIANGTAYSSKSELAYAIPYENSFITWLRPGASGLPRATYVIASGVLNGTRWSDVMHAGPWGYCSAIGQPGTSSDWCDPAQSVAVMRNSYNSSIGISGGGAIMTGSASPGVAYVIGTLSDGGTVRARAIDAGGPSFWAWVVPPGQRLRRVVFYSASGGQVAVQSGAAYNKGL
jgi:hypothetical protein